jgi:hypothetical protein
MPRNVLITSTATPASGETLTSTTYRLLAADGTTVLSTNAPPYTNVSDGLLYVEQTVVQSDAQQDVATHAIAGRVMDLAASSAAAPVLTWTDVGGETEYRVHRSSTAGFTPTGATADSGTCIAVLSAGSVTYTDTGVTGNGSTPYYYRIVSANAAGATSGGNEATSTPAAPSGPTFAFADDFGGTGTLQGRATTWGGAAGVGAWAKVSGADITVSGGVTVAQWMAYLYRNTVDLPATGLLRIKFNTRGAEWWEIKARASGAATALDGIGIGYNPASSGWGFNSHTNGTWNGTVLSTLADAAWTGGATRIVEAELTSTGVDFTVRDGDTLAVIGTRSYVGAPTGAGRIQLAKEDAGDYGPVIDWITFEGA